MLLVQVTYTMRPGQRDNFLKAVRETGILAAIRGEAGCLRYAYYLPEEDDGTLVLLEQWTDAQAQKAHTATEQMAQLNQLKAQYIEHTAILFSESKDEHKK